MTNPNNAVGTNAAYNGRTSPDALNDILGSFTAGIVGGWACVPKTGMTVQLGGTAGTRDVAIAEDNNGNKITVDNRSGAPIDVTIDASPSTNSRIDVIVAYVDNPSTGDGSTTDNPTTCGIIAVKGTVAANPTAPNDTAIRSAITTDGATGGTAYYVKLAEIAVGTSVTTIGSGSITAGAAAISLAELGAGAVKTENIANSAITAAKTAFAGNYSTSEVDTGFKWVDNKTIYKKTINIGALPNNTTKNKAHGISNLNDIIHIEGFARYSTGAYTRIPIPLVTLDQDTQVSVTIDATNISLKTGADRSAASGHITLWYTKTT